MNGGWGGCRMIETEGGKENEMHVIPRQHN